MRLEDGPWMNGKGPGRKLEIVQALPQGSNKDVGWELVFPKQPRKGVNGARVRRHPLEAYALKNFYM